MTRIATRLRCCGDRGRKQSEDLAQSQRLRACTCRHAAATTPVPHPKELRLMIWYLRCGLHALGRGVPCPTNRRGSIHHEGSCWPAPPIPRADPVLQYQPLGYGGQRSVGTATSCCARPHCSIRRGTHPPSTWRCTGPLCQCSTGTSAQSTRPYPRPLATAPVRWSWEPRVFRLALAKQRRGAAASGLRPPAIPAPHVRAAG